MSVIRLHNALPEKKDQFEVEQNERMSSKIEQKRQKKWENVNGKSEREKETFKTYREAKQDRNVYFYCELAFICSHRILYFFFHVEQRKWIL